MPSVHFQNGRVFGAPRVETHQDPISCDEIHEHSTACFFSFSFDTYATDRVETTPNTVKLPSEYSGLSWQHPQEHTTSTQESFLSLHNDAACQLNNKAAYQHVPLALCSELSEAWTLTDFVQDTALDNGDSFDFTEYINFDEDDEMMGEPSSGNSSQSDMDSEMSEEVVPEFSYTPPPSSISSPPSDGPFTCPDCGKQFSRYRDYARRHKKTHEKQKASYECDLCEKKFGRKDSLQRHWQNKACPKLKGKDIRIVLSSYDCAF